MRCPSCEQQEIIKNGKIHNGKQRYKCKNCGRQFVENPQKCRVTEENNCQLFIRESFLTRDSSNHRSSSQ